MEFDIYNRKQTVEASRKHIHEKGLKEFNIHKSYWSKTASKLLNNMSELTKLAKTKQGQSGIERQKRGRCC